jgi:predicted nucleic acid-binding protein
MICLDTPVLIWGVRGFASRGQEHEIDNAGRYIKWLKLKEQTVMIPTPVLAEYLVGESATDRHDGTIFETGFQIAPFDLRAAVIAAELARDIGLIKSIKKEEDVSHQCIKTDIMLAAIAIERKAEKIITTDNGFKIFSKLVGKRITIGRIPEIPLNIDDKQKEMF